MDSKVADLRKNEAVDDIDIDIDILVLVLVLDVEILRA